MKASQQKPDLIHTEPEVGNYFVSAYPPFSCWETGELGEVHRALASPASLATAYGESGAGKSHSRFDEYGWSPYALLEAA
jgi:hypothetical protein